MINHVKRIVNPVTLSQASFVVQKTCHSESTKTWYKTAANMLIDYFGDVSVTSVTSCMIDQWSENLDVVLTKRTKEPLAPSSKNGHRRAVRSFFNHLEKLHHIDPAKNPVKNFKFATASAHDPRHLKADDIAKLMRLSKPNIRDHAIMHVLYSTGCRRSELVNMRLSALTIEQIKTERVKTEGEKLLIELARESSCAHLIKDQYLYELRGKAIVEGKGQDGRAKTRPIFMDHDCCTALRRYIESRPINSTDKVFLSSQMPKGGGVFDGITNPTLNSLFKRYARMAGIPHASPHMMRHTFAYRLIRNGADAKMVQKLLGHEEVTTTLDIYYNFSSQELWDVYEDFGKSNAF